MSLLQNICNRKVLYEAEACAIRLPKNVAQKNSQQTHLNTFDAPPGEALQEQRVAFLQVESGHLTFPHALTIDYIAKKRASPGHSTLIADIQILKNDRPQFRMQRVDRWLRSFVPDAGRQVRLGRQVGGRLLFAG